MISNYTLGNSDAPRTLCITRTFPKMRDSEAYRSGKFVDALMEPGAEITSLFTLTMSAGISNGRRFGSDSKTTDARTKGLSRFS